MLLFAAPPRRGSHSEDHSSAGRMVAQPWADPGPARIRKGTIVSQSEGGDGGVVLMGRGQFVTACHVVTIIPIIWHPGQK